MSRYVVAEWRLATESLGAALVCRRAGYHRDAVSRTYYAVLHAAKAALQLHDVDAESHAAVRRLFGKHIVRTGLVEVEWGGVIGQIADRRMISDYDATRTFDEADAHEAYERAEAFMERIRTLLAERVQLEDLEEG